MKTKALDLETKKFIETLWNTGRKSPWISKELGVSVWVVRKWLQRIKKRVRL